MEPKIVLFATSMIDAQNYCDMNGLVFSDIIWVLNYQLLGVDGLKGATEVHYTEIFKHMPAYNEAVIGEAKDKEIV